MKHEMMIWLRYALVGMCNTVVGLGLIALLMHEFRWTHTSATLLGNLVGVLFSYGCNRYFTFRDQGKTGRSLLRFTAVSFMCYFIAYVLLHEPLARIVTIVLPVVPYVWQEDAVIVLEAAIYTVLSFVLHRVYTFHTPGKQTVINTSSEPK